MIPSKHSFKLLSRAEVKKIRLFSSSKKENFAVVESKQDPQTSKESETGNKKRTFLKLAGLVGLGTVASLILPKKAEGIILGGTPTSSVVGVKDATNTRINPATDEKLDTLLVGQGVTKLTINLAASGNVRTPASGKKIRVYASRFSLTADATSVSFKFVGSSDHEKYVSPKTGGLYGANNHPNYIEGGVDGVLYCTIVGTTTVQINIDYLEV